MEKAKNIAVLPGDFGWSRRGLLRRHPRGAPRRRRRATSSPATPPWWWTASAAWCSPTSGPLTVVGLTDMVVVDSGDAVLVVPKDKSQDVRKVVEALKALKRDKFL